MKSSLSARSGGAVLALLALMLLGGCGALRKVYEYHPPSTFDEHRWGQRIEEFDHLELISSCRLDSVSCTTAQPLEITAYIRRPQSFQYGEGVQITSAAYLFCYDGIATRFCGSAVNYESEEFELANHQETSDGLTNNERLLRVLVRSYGLPHRGTLAHTQVKVFDSHGNFIVPEGLKPQRYSWCGLNDPHAPKECPVSVVMQFNPMLGHGHVLYATPQLREAASQWQQYDLFPDEIYDNLYQYDKPMQMPVPIACHSSSAAQRPDPLDRVVLMQESRLFSEMMLDILAFRNDSPRDIPSRPLSPADWFEQVRFVESQLTAYSKDGARQAYWFGYSLGARHTYFGGDTDTEDAHAKWLKAKEASEAYVMMVGLGYRDGVRFDPHPPRAVAARSPKDVQIETAEIHHLQEMSKGVRSAPR